MLKHSSSARWIQNFLFTLVVMLSYLWKTWGDCLSISGENCGLLDAGKCIRETARQLRIDPETICTWRDKFCSNGKVKDRSCAGRPRVTSVIQAGTCTFFFKTTTFLMWPRVNQMSRTLLFQTNFMQTRYQIKANTQTHMAKYTELFLCLLFFK